MTDKEKALERFCMSADNKVGYIPQCAVCKNVNGLFCKATNEKRPEKYYLDDNPEFQKCPNFKLNNQSPQKDKFIKLSKNYKW